jgi:hypothetical protein
MSKHEVVYYEEGKKKTRTISNVTKISKEKNLLRFSVDGSDDVLFLASRVLSYKKIGE